MGFIRKKGTMALSGFYSNMDEKADPPALNKKPIKKY
jgi:hypothetical protein